jgi:molybdate transport system ATP-binding protein
VTAALGATIRLRREDFTLDVELSVPPGRVLAVLGPNGAGKSTALGVIAGLLRPDRGAVKLGDRVLVDTGVFVPAHRRGVALLEQRPLLFPHLTALRNVAFGPRARGMRRAAADATARRWLATVDAAELAGRRPARLSGGQGQRVALARALAVEPDLLLLDEPLAALDVDAAPAIRALLRRVLVDRTALLITHDVLDALVLADEVAVLVGGRVVERGPTRRVLAEPRSPFAARIAGLNLVTGTGSPQGLRTPDGTLISASQSTVDGGAAVAVFSPAAVAVHAEPPSGSSRNVVGAVVAGLEPRGDLVRVRVRDGPAWAVGLAADVTLAAAAELRLEPGLPVWLAVKATEVAVHQAPGHTGQS